MVEGRISLPALTAELVKLHHKLQFATNKYRGSGGDGRRPAVRIALNALSDFLGNVYALDQDLRLPINELLYAIDDLDRGKVLELVEPAKVDHRPPNPLSNGLFRATAAALMEVYKLDKMPRKQAAAHAARKLNKLGYRSENGQRITAKEVENWRDLMKERQGKNDIAADRYATILSELKSKYPKEPKKAAQFLLGVLPDMIPPTIPANP